MLCLVLNAPTIEEDLLILERNRKYISLVELRVDMLRNPMSAKGFPDRTDLSVILTIRRPRDGGRFQGTEEDRKSLLRELSESSFSYVDIEADLNFPSLEYSLMARGVDIIRSIHDFDGIPKDLPEFIRSVASCGEIPKTAVTLSSQDDVDEFARVAEMVRNIPRKILIGMGHFGRQTRINYRKYGSMLTFCVERNFMAVGLMTPEELYNLSKGSQDDISAY